MIVTNLNGWYGDEEVIPAGKLSLAEWCHIYVERPINVQQRVYLLSDSEVGEFYRYLPSGNRHNPHVMPMKKEVYRHEGNKEFSETLPDLAWRQQMQIEGTLPNGCLFILDEAHLFFNARKWQSLSVAVSHYMSQLRKLNDDIILISQNPEKIDKSFRGDVTEVVYVKNCAKASYWMGVKFPGKIKLFKFRFFPQKHDKPESTTVIQLKEERYQDTYDTMSGVGLAGKMDPETVPKGGHWWRWVAAGAVVLAVIIEGPRLGMSMIGKTVGSFMGQFHAGIDSRLHKSGSLPVGPSPLPPVAAPVAVQSGVAPSVPTATELKTFLPQDKHETNTWVTGMSFEGDRHCKVWLSDGTEVQAGDGRLQWVGRDEVKIDGVYYTRHVPRAVGGQGGAGGRGWGRW